MKPVPWPRAPLRNPSRPLGAGLESGRSLPNIEGKGSRTAHARPIQSNPRLSGAPRSLVIALDVAAVAALVITGSPATGSSTPTTKPGYLFSIPAAAGTLTGPDDRHLTLRLTGTRDYLTRFTDRPIREAFVVANVDFARRFAREFATSDPNAVLTYTPLRARIPVSIVLTLGRPLWNARQMTWTVPAERIRKQPDNLPTRPSTSCHPPSHTRATSAVRRCLSTTSSTPTTRPADRAARRRAGAGARHRINGAGVAGSRGYGRRGAPRTRRTHGAPISDLPRRASATPWGLCATDGRISSKPAAAWWPWSCRRFRRRDQVCSVCRRSLGAWRCSREDTAAMQSNTRERLRYGVV